MRTDTELYTMTYRDLILLVKELDWWYWHLRDADDLNKAQAKRIMELEFDLMKYSRIMGEDKQEAIVNDYATPLGEIISLDEERKVRRKQGGGKGGSGDDWLSGMIWGTQFYVRPKAQRGWVLTKFMMAGIRNKTVLLVPMMGDENTVSDDRAWVAVDPKLFCRAWELFDLFPPIELEEE